MMYWLGVALLIVLCIFAAFCVLAVVVVPLVCWAYILLMRHMLKLAAFGIVGGIVVLSYLLT